MLLPHFTVSEGFTSDPVYCCAGIGEIVHFDNCAIIRKFFVIVPLLLPIPVTVATAVPTSTLLLNVTV